MTNGDTTLYYVSLADAYDACPAGGTIVLENDIDLSGEANDYIVVEKDITIDLNGHILDISSNFENDEYKVKADHGAVITLDDTSDSVGGVKGVCGANGEENS